MTDEVARADPALRRRAVAILLTAAVLSAAGIQWGLPGWSWPACAGRARSARSALRAPQWSWRWRSRSSPRDAGSPGWDGVRPSCRRFLPRAALHNHLFWAKMGLLAGGAHGAGGHGHGSRFRRAGAMK